MCYLDGKEGMQSNNYAVMSAPEDNVPPQKKSKGNIRMPGKGSVQESSKEWLEEKLSSEITQAFANSVVLERRGVQNSLLQDWPVEESLKNFSSEVLSDSFWTDTQQKYAIAKMILCLTALLLLIIWETQNGHRRFGGTGQC